jgi:hypothetical protein
VTKTHADKAIPSLPEEASFNMHISVGHRIPSCQQPWRTKMHSPSQPRPSSPLPSPSCTCQRGNPRHPREGGITSARRLTTVPVPRLTCTLMPATGSPHIDGLSKQKHSLFRPRLSLPSPFQTRQRGNPWPPQESSIATTVLD